MKTANEIKKAWNEFKKNLGKEGIDNTGMTMSMKQIEKRTATMCAANVIEYDDVVKANIDGLAKIMGYTSWTDAEKAKAKERIEATIAKATAEKAKYGTKANAAKILREEIVNSKAFAIFASKIESTVTAHIEMSSDGFAYMIRFNY